MTSSKEQKARGCASLGMEMPFCSALRAPAGSSHMMPKWQEPLLNLDMTERRFSSRPRTTGIFMAARRSITRLPEFLGTPKSFLTKSTPQTSRISEGSCSFRLYTNTREWPHSRSCSTQASSMRASRGKALASSKVRPTSTAVFAVMSRTPCKMFASSSYNTSSARVRIMALSSCRGCSSSSWPRTLSSIKDKGQTIGMPTMRTKFTSGTMAAAKVSCFGPVKIAEGIISPKINTTVTDKTTANQEGTKPSRNSGNASFAAELSNNKVTNK
mmetsp:Transcript_69349/g.200906  ORF Transcript_69349/g.200906 Transcript_69349/m.200906 type:complete len:271 (-) Transcript_69349:50-862(-)